MELFDRHSRIGAGKRDGILVWATTGAALVCSVLIFLATNSASLTPVAPPQPSVNTPVPIAVSSVTTTLATAIVAPPPDTTVVTTQPTTKPAPVTTAPRTTPPPARRTTTTVSTTTVQRCVADYWRRDTAYAGGSMVVYAGSEWTARWWNYNAEPGANAEGVWAQMQTC